jgi:predicted GNAT superfamily acetyltransferase
MAEWTIHLLETPEEITAVEALQRQVWPGSETDVIPAHMLLAAIHNGGLALGAFVGDELIGAVFGFPGFYQTPDGPRLKHHSHILGVHPDWNGRGIGFALKRAQWQMIRKQGLDRITWTYDPLLSRNAHLNISRLGAVCNTYLRSEYGVMRDDLNAGLPSDRFQVDWWVNTKRVERRLSRRARPALTLEHYRTAEATLFEADTDRGPWLSPPEETSSPRAPACPRAFRGSRNRDYSAGTGTTRLAGTLLLLEIPSDFPALKTSDMALARDWRFYTREVFEDAFARGYLVTDFVHDQGRSFYVLTHEASTLQGD